MKYFQVTQTGTVGIYKKEIAQDRKKQDKIDDAPKNVNNFLHVNKRGF